MFQSQFFQNNKFFILAIASVIFIVGLLNLIVPVSFNNAAADAEVLVDQARKDCASTYDNGIKSVIEMSQVDQHTKKYLIDLIEAATPEQKVQINDAYAQFVNGNSQPFMLLMGGMSGTNFTATAENVQREISAQRSSMLVCSKMLNATQKELKKVLGMDASGRVMKWPQTLLNLDYPSVLADPTLRDNDGDGQLTVLDYRPPVDVKINDSFGTGEGLPPVDIYQDPE